MNLMERHIEKAKNFLSDLDTEVEILDFVDINNLDVSDAFTEIRDSLEDNNAFDVEMIYYAKAMEYLTENDPSLVESMRIAAEMGFEVSSLNSETLASLHVSQKVREEFDDLESEIEEFFDDLVRLYDEIRDNKDMIVDDFNSRFGDHFNNDDKDFDDISDWLQGLVDFSEISLEDKEEFFLDFGDEIDTIFRD